MVWRSTQNKCTLQKGNKELATKKIWGCKVIPRFVCFLEQMQQKGTDAANKSTKVAIIKRFRRIL